MRELYSKIEELSQKEVETLYFLVRLADPALFEPVTTRQILRFQSLKDLEILDPDIIRQREKEIISNLDKLKEKGLVTFEENIWKFNGDLPVANFVKRHATSLGVKPIEDGFMGYIFDRILFHKFPPVRAHISGRDSSISFMQKKFREGKLWLYRQHPERFTPDEVFRRKALFVKLGVSKDTFPCIAELQEDTMYEKTVDYLKSIEGKLNLLEIYLQALEILPLPRIPPFPFITVATEIEREVGKELAENYFRSFEQDSDAIRTWFEDFIKARREIINTKLKRLALAAPIVMKPIEVFILYDPKVQRVKARYYTADMDKVLIKEVEQTVLKSDTAFESLFELPPKKNWIYETTRATYEKRKVYESWDHPYLAAMKDIKEELEQFNRQQDPCRYDADAATLPRIKEWVSQRINETRNLVNRLPHIKHRFTHILNPIYHISIISKDPPYPGKRRDGTLISYYFTGKENKIEALEFETKEEIPPKEELIKSIFPDLDPEAVPFWEIHSGLLYYLIDKTGGY